MNRLHVSAIVACLSLFSSTLPADDGTKVAAPVAQSEQAVVNTGIEDGDVITPANESAMTEHSNDDMLEGDGVSDDHLQELLMRYHDPAFSRFVDLKVLIQAVEQLDAGILADVVLLLNRAETILQRNHRYGITAEALLKKALVLAAGNHDDATISRLAQAAKEFGRDSWLSQIDAAREFTSPSRTPAPTVELSSIDGALVALASRVNDEITRTSLTDDKERLVFLTKEIETLQNTAPATMKYLLERIEVAIAAVPTKQDDTAILLDEFSSATRSDKVFRITNHSSRTVYIAVKYFLYEPGSSLMCEDPTRKHVVSGWYRYLPGETGTAYVGNQTDIAVHFADGVMPREHNGETHFLVHGNEFRQEYGMSNNANFPKKLRWKENGGWQDITVGSTAEALRHGWRRETFYRLRANANFTIN